MSFTLIKNAEKQLYASVNYKEVAAEFCKEYYASSDQNIYEIGRFYMSNAQITFLDVDVIGIDEYMRVLRNHGIVKLLHNNLSIIAQPIGYNNLIITVNGDIITNNSPLSSKFSETFFIQRGESNKFLIFSSLFNTVK